MEKVNDDGRMMIFTVLHVQRKSRYLYLYWI